MENQNQASTVGKETGNPQQIIEKSDLQALLSELQSFPLLQKLVEDGGIHIHIHWNVQTIGNVSNSVLVGVNVSGNDNSINSSKLNGVN
ncbi:hypothetical protein EZS27_007525 [termite gut metagenome]|uniref:Uncharacterized protein n=1 Tax=termite gut metagenome TaxID=433724 RepID=A0A5J4SFD1_9ZZZZ